MEVVDYRGARIIQYNPGESWFIYSRQIDTEYYYRPAKDFPTLKEAEYWLKKGWKKDLR